MDEQRFKELERKRFEEGLSDDEANELGRMMAERSGEEYESAAARRPDEESLRSEEAEARANQPDTQERGQRSEDPGERTRELTAQEMRQEEGKDPATVDESR